MQRLTLAITTTVIRTIRFYEDRDQSKLGQSPWIETKPGKRDHKKEYMRTITTKEGVEIFYKDWGQGQPIVFSHGWPLSADDWDAQMMFLLGKGFRVIAHDRRGHVRSTQSSTGPSKTIQI